MIRAAVAILALYCIAAWASAQINSVIVDLDQTIEDLERCRVESVASAKQARMLARNLELAEQRADTSARLMQQSYAAEMDKTFALMRAKDTIRALQASAGSSAVATALPVAAPEAAPKIQVAPKKRKARKVVAKKRAAAVRHDWWPF